MADKTVVKAGLSTTRGEVIVEFDGKSHTLVLTFERMDICEQFLGKDWSMVKIARMTSQEWNIPLRVIVAIIDAAAQEDGFTARYAVATSWIQAAATATALVVRALTGNVEARDMGKKLKEEEKPSEE